jgi:hypothetical protein
MGLKLRGAFRCGACGKPLGLGTHLCAPGKRRRRRTTLQNPVTWECRTCRESRGLRHTCRQRSDFKARKRKAATDERRRKRKATRDRQAARRKQAAADRRARDRARKRAAKGSPRPSRSRGDSHEPGSCGDPDCPKYGCKAYWEGVDNCPRLHEGE